MSEVLRRVFVGNFVRFPKKIIMNNNLSTLRMSIFTYMAQNRTLRDTVNMSINDMVLYFGYLPNPRVGKINDKFILLLNELEYSNYFSRTQGKYSGDKLCTLKLNISQFDPNGFYSCITLNELERIRSYGIESRQYTLFDKIILTLAYIRLNKLRRSKKQDYVPSDKPEFFYKLIKDMAFDINVNESIVSQCIKILNDLDIIVSSPMPRYKDTNGNWHTDVTIFVDKYEGWEQELRWGIDFLKTGKKLKYVQGSGTKGGDDMD